jgi:hypothetical protein
MKKKEKSAVKRPVPVVETIKKVVRKIRENKLYK